MKELQWIFRDREGRLRSGWAILVFVLANIGVAELLVLASPALRTGSLLQTWLLLISSLAATAIGCLVVGQPISAAGFGDRRWWERALVGFVLGAVVVGFLVGVPWAAGREGLAGPAVGTNALVLAGGRQLAQLAPPSAAEEVLLRGFFLQQLVRGTNRWAAVLITGTLFGLAHLGNPNVVPLGIVNIVLAGWWLGVLVLRTGSLWLTIGMHIAWNWFEGFVWGQPVSGMPMDGALVHVTSAKSMLWTGSAFGPEASLPTAVAVIALTVVALAWRPEPNRGSVVSS